MGDYRILALVAMGDRNKNVYFAKLAEQAERYDEMADYMEAVGGAGDELSVEERNLLSVAYKNAVGSRRAAWRIITSVEQKEKSKGNEDNAKFAKEYCGKVEGELDKICNTILKLLDDKLIAKASGGESKVFYQKMKADYYRYIAEYKDGDAKKRCCGKCPSSLCSCSGSCREGFGCDSSYSSWPRFELLRVPVRSLVQSR